MRRGIRGDSAGATARQALLYAERAARNVWRQRIAHTSALPVGATISLSAGVASLDLVANATAEEPSWRRMRPSTARRVSGRTAWRSPPARAAAAKLEQAS